MSAHLVLAWFLHLVGRGAQLPSPWLILFLLRVPVPIALRLLVVEDDHTRALEFPRLLVALLFVQQLAVSVEPLHWQLFKLAYEHAGLFGVLLPFIRPLRVHFAVGRWAEKVTPEHTRKLHPYL